MATTFDMDLAGLTFHVQTVHAYAKDLCKNYLTDDHGTYPITITEEMTAAQREKCREDTDTDVAALANTSDAFLESICLLRALADEAALHGGLLMHGSSVAVDGKGYIFTALSGTGKSTHTRLLRQLLGDRIQMVNDDKPFLRVTPEQIYLCGSPWQGKHNLGNNMQVPLCGIFFLRRNPDNVVGEMSVDRALPIMLEQCNRPEKPENMLCMLEMLDRILNEVPLYDFGCNMDISAAELSYSKMQ